MSSRSESETSPASSRSTDSERLFGLLRWATIVFVFASIQLPTSHVYIKSGVYVSLGVWALFDLAWRYLVPRRWAEKNQFIELTLDIVWITLLQLPTGQIHSPFYFIYAMPVLCGALVLDGPGVRRLGVAAALILVPILFLHLWGEPLDLNHVFSYFVRFGLIFFCAFIGSLLAGGEEGTEQRV